MNLRQPQQIITHILFVLLLLACSSVAFAYSQYSAGCDNCHGEFDSGNYTSNSDGTAWGTNLMSGHSAFGITCNACHTSGNVSDVYLNSSSDATLSKSCVGCHMFQQ